MAKSLNFLTFHNNAGQCLVMDNYVAGNVYCRVTIWFLEGALPNTWLSEGLSLASWTHHRF